MKKPVEIIAIIMLLSLLFSFFLFFITGCKTKAETNIDYKCPITWSEGQAESTEKDGSGNNVTQGTAKTDADNNSNIGSSDTGKNGDQGSSQAKAQTSENEITGKDNADLENNEGNSGKSGDTTNSSGQLEEDLSEGEELKVVASPPVINLHIIMGPEYAQDNQVCFYRVMADVSGQPFPSLSFSKDDSNGAWGPNVSQVNLLKDETFILKCDASNSQGTASAEITLAWVQNPDDGQENENAELSPEIFIDYTDSANFLVDVNLTVQQVTVLYKDAVIKAMPCSGGKPETPTPLGTFTTNQKIYYAWIPKFAQGAFYWTRFYGPYLFHSVPYDSTGNMMVEELGKMGTPASHGCVRLLLEDAKWFYETLPLGIKVNIHN